MGLTLLDSSVVVAFLDADDTLHALADAAMRAAAPSAGFAVSTITLAELLVGAGLGHSDAVIVRRFLETIVPERLAVDDAVAERAAGIRTRHPALRLPDALILATADLHADAVLTADSTWRKVRGLTTEVVDITR